MADFERAFRKTLENEGGFLLHEVPGDKGGQTYAGIARKFHPDWSGWKLIDQGITEDVTLTQLVRGFYRQKFWNLIKGDEIEDQSIAEAFYDTVVNMGIVVGTKAVQSLVGEVQDGVVGPRTLRAINSQREIWIKASDVFDERLLAVKVARRVGVVRKDRSQIKFIVGWLTRDLKGTS